MQLLVSMDVEGCDLGFDPKTVAVMVFVDSYYETDLYEPEACAVVQVDRAGLEAHPTTAAPDDFVAETMPDTIVTEFGLKASPPDDEPSEADSFAGGEPVWPEETGAPKTLPGGKFVAQLSYSNLSFTRPMATLYAFEEGAVIVPHIEDDDECPVSWTEAISTSLEVVVGDTPPADGALVKFGGAPKHYPWWPTNADDRPLTHLMTLPPDSLGELGEDAMAVAVFVDLERARGEWDDPDFLELLTIDSDDDPDEGPPEGVELLEPRSLELIPIAEDTHWRQLRGRSFVGPRRFNYQPDDADTTMVLQLECSLLPGVTKPGALYLGDLMMGYQAPDVAAN